MEKEHKDALYMADLGLAFRMIPWALPSVIPECRDESDTWALLGVGQPSTPQKKKRNKIGLFEVRGKE